MFIRGKYLGKALLCACALLATTASAASAATHDFEAAAPYIITGTQTSESEHIEYSFGAKWTLKCGADKTEGTIEESSTTQLTLFPTHSECLLNTLSATVDSAGCNYIFSGKTDANGHGAVELECLAGSLLKVTVSGCTLEIGPQLFKKGASYQKTEGEGHKDIDVKLTTEAGIYKKAGFLCETIGGNGGDLSMRGSYTLKAYQDNKGVEGSQTDFTFKTTNP